MVIQDVWRQNKYKKLVDKLKANPEGIEHTEAPIKNNDILKLLEVSKKITKSEAIQFAVNFTIENLSAQVVYADRVSIDRITLSPTEKKLEKLRYAAKEAHDASDELLDSENLNKHYPGKLKC